MNASNPSYIVLAALLALMLAGCGRNSTGSSATAAATSGGDPSSAASPATPVPSPEHGRQLFATTCAACHGQDAHGLPHLGKNLVASTFVAGQSDEQLLAFVKHGRDPSDPLNTTGVAMPPRGGNPALSDNDLRDIMSFIRTVNQGRKG